MRLRTFAILFLAFALRVVGLGRESLWYDEAFTLRFARRSFADLYALLVREAWDGPVYPTLVWIWVRLVGWGDWQVRALSAVCGTLAVLALHGFARRLFDRRTADLAAFLAAVSQIAIAYSQEARCYALLLALVLAAASAFVDARRQGARGGRFWAFAALAGLATLTHYYAVFFLIALACHALATGVLREIPPKRALAGVALYALVLAPWLASGVVASAAAQPVAGFERVAPWFAVDPWTIVRTIGDFHGGRMDGLLARAPRWTHPVGALLFGVPALLALARRADRRATVFLAVLWLAPIVLAVALSAARVQFAPRYVLFALAPYLALVARGLATMRPAARAGFLAGILAWTALSLRALYGVPHKEDWRGALRELALGARLGDRVLFLPFGDAPLEWAAYHPRGPELDVVALDDLPRLACERLWVLTYSRVAVEDPRAARARELLARERPVRATDRFLVRLELYRPGPGGSPTR